MPYTYRCRDYPGMEACPASFTAESASEVMKHVDHRDSRNFSGLFQSFEISDFEMELRIVLTRR